MKLPTNPKKLFFIDGCGAILSAFLLGIVLVRFEKYIGMPIKSFSDSSGIWFKNDTYETPVIVESGYEWVAVLMYGINEAHGSGIQFFEPGIGIKCENIHGHHKTDFIKSKFNRIVFFKGNNRHMIVDDVGNTIRSCGLTQRFYFN